MTTATRLPTILIPRRYPASTARAYFVRLGRFVSDSGEPVEITRRGKKSVFLVRAPDFERCLVGVHPWGKRREFPSRPLGINPGVYYAWTNRSATVIRDHFAGYLEWVDQGGNPLLVVRRGKCPLLLLARRTFLAFWKPLPPTQ